MRRGKFLITALAAAALTLVLSACMFNASPEDLYELPQLPEEYTALRTQLDAILAEGAENAAPVSGTNIQSVQLTDLDGDGVEEAVAFFRSSNDERPLKIYIFRAVEDSYEQAAVIEGSGTAIYSIRYVDMDRDGRREILVGWRISPEIQALGVYSISGYEPTPLMFSLYTRYEVLDFDGDGLMEIVLLRSDENGTPVAEYYDWSGTALEVQSICSLSMTMAELNGMDIGTLRDGEPALFITGVAEDTRLVTDILTYKQEAITNIVRSDNTGVTSAIYRYVSLSPTDINSDGVTEVPVPVVLPSTGLSAEETYWQVYWRSYSAGGEEETVLTTYHNVGEGWYLELPESWDGRIAVRQAGGSDEKETVFSLKNSDGTYADFLAIYALTGNSREYRATRNGRFILKRQVSTIYAGTFLAGNEGWRYAIDQEELSQRFHLITREWATGEN